MSTTIDNRVVEMRFDNKQFESNVATSMSTLDKLKQKLNLNGAAKGLDSINSAAKNVNLNGLSSGIDVMHAKFSALEVMGVTALANITNSAVNAGKRIVSALTIDPVKTGFQEYETQMGAIQTILANTQKEGTNVERVNAALDQLNTYADKTIYNFTEMTKNIGTFTAAGVKLDTSVNAIKGIANLAAISGSTSQQASTAMYQLSQALAAGKVSLMDWNSVVNAGMGGQVFQDALIRTSEHLKTGAKEAINMYGSFRESLTKGEWLTTQVLTETLNQLSGAYSEAELIAQGYSEAQAKEIMNLAKTAEAAATEVKTFTQLWDTLKEAAQSGWGQTWRLIVGDFEKAKERLSKLSELFSGMISKSADRRNSLLGGALNSKWDQLTEKLNAAGIKTEDFQNKVKELAKSHNVDLDSMIKKEGSFEKALIKCFRSGKLDKSVLSDALKSFVSDITGATKSTGKMAEQMEKYGKIVDKVIKGDFGNGEERIKRLTEAGYDYATVQNLVNEKLGSSVKRLSALSEEQIKNADNLSKLSDKQLKNKGYTEEQITALRDLEKAANDSGSSINELINNFEKPSGAELIWDSLFDILYSIIEPIKAVGKAWREIFSPMTSEQLYSAIEGFNNLTGSLKSFATNTDNLDKLTRSFKGLFAALEIVTTIAGGGFKLAFKVLSKVLSAFDMDVLDLTANLGDAIVKFRDFLFDNKIINKGFELLADGITKATEAIGKLCDAFTDLPQVQKLVERLKEIFNNLKEVDLSEVGQNIIDGLKNGLEDGISSVPGILLEIGRKIIETIKGVLGIHSPSTVMFEIGTNVIEGLVNGLQNGISKIGEVLKNIASTIGEVLSDIPWSKLFAAGVTISLLYVVKQIADAIKGMASAFEGFGDLLEGAGNVLRSFGKVLKGIAWDFKAKAMLKFAISLGILVVALIALSRISVPDLTKAVVTIGVLSGILIGLAFAMDKMTQASVKIGKGGASIDGLKAGLLQIGLALLLLAAAVKLVGSMKPEEAKQGFMALTALVVEMAAFIAACGFVSKKGSTKNMDKIGSMMLKLSIALMLMVGVVKLVGTLSAEEMLKGAVFAAAFAVFVRTITAVAKGSGKNISKVGGMALKLSIAMALMVGVCKLAGMLSAEEMFKGAAFAAGFTVFVAALVLVSKLFPQAAIQKISGLVMSITISLMLMVGVCKLVSMLSAGEVVKGIAFVTAFMLMVKALVKITTIGSDKQMVKVAVTLLAMSVSIAILAAVSIALSLIDLGGLAKGLVAVSLLGSVMTAMIWATRGANDVKGSIIAMSVAIAIMAAAVIALSFIDGTKLAGATAAISIMMGMFALIAKSAGSMGKVMGPLIVMTLAVGALAGIIYLLSSLNIGSTIEIAASLSMLMMTLAVSMQMISLTGGLALSAIAPMAGLVIVLGGIALIIGALSKCEVGSTLEIATSLSTLLLSLSAVCAILSVVGMTGPAAFVGIGALITLIASVGTLMLAIGALVTYFPKMEEFLNNGIPILEKIGYGLGSFFGNVVGGFTSVVTSGLPEIATNLTDFMSNLQGFVDGVSGVDEESLTGVKNLTQMFALLAGANILENVSKWLTGESSMETFSANLDLFADAIVSFSNKVKGSIDEESVMAAANAGKVLAEMSAVLPNSGGLISLFTGENDMATFASQLGAFGQGIKDFGTAVSGVDPEAISSSAIAAKALAEVANTIPNSGGLLSLLAGENDITLFAKKLVPFGEGMKQYSDAVVGIDAGSIKNSASAAKTLVNMASDIPNSGGVVSWFTGDNDLEAFAEKLVPFGEGMKQYSDAVVGIDVGAIKSSVSAAKTLVNMASAIPNSGGVASWFTGDNDLSAFAKKLVPFGKSLKTYSTSVTGINASAVSNATSAFKSIVSLAKSSSGVDFGGLSSFSKSLGKIGKDSVNNFVNAFNGAGPKLANAGKSMMSGLTNGINSGKAAATKAVSQTITQMSKSLQAQKSNFTTVGAALMAGQASGISSKASVVIGIFSSVLSRAAATARSYYGSFYSAGASVAIGFANGISANSYLASARARAMASAAYQAAKNELDVNSPSKIFRSLGYSVPEGFAMGIDRLSYLASNSATAMAKTAFGETKAVISRIADAIDSGRFAEPSIRPVLDLSNIESGASAINGLLNDRASVGVLGNVSAINSIMNRRQNIETTADVVSAIKDLKDAIGNSSGDTYTINGVTYDDGSNVSEAVKELIRAARVERRT